MAKQREQSKRPAENAQPTGAAQPAMPHPNWRESKGFIAASSAVASFVVSMTVYTQMVLPYQTARLEDEIRKRDSELAEREEQISALEKSSEDARRAHKLVEDELASSIGTAQRLAAELYESRLKSLFTPGDPYPNGAEKVKLGMPINDVSATYTVEAPSVSDPDDTSWITVTFENSPITRGTYYFDEFESVRIFV